MEKNTKENNYPVGYEDRIRTLTSGRKYLLNVPSEASEFQQALPLVLVFHGAEQNPAEVEKFSQFSTAGLKIASLPVIAAYLQGADNEEAEMKYIWSSAPYQNKEVDDIQFTLDVIGDVSARISIDTKKIFAAGVSNGGGMVNRISCTPSTNALLAGVALVCPALYSESLAFSGDFTTFHPIPCITCHGVIDEIIPFQGRASDEGEYGVGRATIEIPLWWKNWAVRNGCDEAKVIKTTPHPDTIEYLWEGGKADVKAFQISSLGHAWPVLGGKDETGNPSKATFNFTLDEVIGFFGKQSLQK